MNQPVGPIGRPAYAVPAAQYAPMTPPGQAGLVTGLCAAAFAAGLGAMAGWGSYSAFSVFMSFSSEIRARVGIQSWMVFQPPAAALLLIGAILLLCRLTAGRVMVIAGCAALVAQQVWSTADYLVDSTTVDGSLVVFLLMLSGPPIATAILAGVPPTGKWIRTRRSVANPVAPQPYLPR
ncbi:hypothetical protein [Nocardia huaxiensis]|uniref:Uncharacterized protein n=1 Tax=Nocardia huaxiensis TaxID=2755382 RepID=A0A7D6VAV7_9NOCA|nr:hypothetical protein [Nocardia huaxiensis]QLY30671.1 hypothetical protein H0264_37175 [Nocardia huaxiensis]UFS94162.1 hypothetical protein LPY97_25770 [Nocardia huaxiensis]